MLFTNQAAESFMESSLEFKYRVIPVDRLPQLQEDIDRIKNSGQLSDNPVFRSYIANKGFSLPDDFRQAKSLIVVAYPSPPALVNFCFDRDSWEIIIPPGYYNNGFNLDRLQQELLAKVIGDPNSRLEKAEAVHLKLLAARSGLGHYGRNNICYVDGMGSFITLLAFFTDHVFEQYTWEEIRFLDQCSQCQACLKSCPTGAIRNDTAVIDVGRCITLYNEIEGTFPVWIPTVFHNALFGCMKCQAICPANHAAMKHMLRLEDISEKETHHLLANSLAGEEAASVGEKLHMPYLAGSTEFQTILSRNLRVLMEKPTARH